MALSLRLISLSFLTLSLSCDGNKVADTDAAATSTPSTAGTLQISTVEKIVAVTDPVKAFAVTDTSTAAVEARNFDKLQIGSGLQLTASTGVSLGDKASTINAAFNTASGSKACCETVNNAMKFFKESSTPDMHLCILRTMASKAATIKAVEPQTWDIKITMPQGSMTYRMKFAFEADEAGGVKSFENFTCEGQGAKLTQSGYVKQTITDGVLKVHARAQSDKGSAPVVIRADVDGQVDSKGKMVGLKLIDYAESSDTRSVHSKVKQSAGHIEVLGYEKVGDRLTQYLSFTEILDKNKEDELYAITKIAYGDGAALIKQTEGNASPSTYLEGWNGDTLALNASEIRLDKVKSRATELLAATGDTLDLTFAKAETYDCTGTADLTIEAKMEDFMTEPSCMSAFDIDQDGSNLCSSLSYSPSL